MTLNNSEQSIAALREATALTRDAPWLAEAWNQRAIAHFALNRYEESVRDCRQTLEINPYHFAAAAGMGQCYLKQGDRPHALEAFRRAIGLNPEMEGVRAQVQQLERSLKRNP
jgi:tetratricopeptide (TPR) repeat protein